jgi:cytidine deaminase
MSFVNVVESCDETRPDLKRIHVATSFKDAEIFVSMIRSSGCEILGFDMEWRPEYKKGEIHPIALIQLATDTEIVLFHLSPMSFRIPTALKNLLEDPKLKKVGFGLSEDIKRLYSQKVSVKSTYDLDLLIKSLGCRKSSLQSLTARVLDLYLDKRKKLTCSNWEKSLTREQILYAATDAWVVLKLYKKLLPHFNFGNIFLFDHFCFICNQDMGMNTRLFIHMLYHHYTTVFPCLLCKKVFASYGAVQSHILAHENGHICKICLYEFPDIISCVYHKLEANHSDYLFDSRTTTTITVITPIHDPKISPTTLPIMETSSPSSSSSSSSSSTTTSGLLGNSAARTVRTTTTTTTTTNLSPKTIPCSKCKRIFRTQSALNDHFNSKHSESDSLPTLIAPTTLMV